MRRIFGKKTSPGKKPPAASPSLAWEIFDSIVPLGENPPASPANQKARLSNAELRGFEKKGSAYLGPYSLEEFGQLGELFA